MLRYVFSHLQQRLTTSSIRAYTGASNTTKVLVPRIPQPKDDVVQVGAEMKPPLLPPCPKATTTPMPKEPAAQQARPAQQPAGTDHHQSTHHEEVVNNIGGAPVSFLHH